MAQTRYTKRPTQGATVQEATALAEAASYPAIVGARFAVVVSVVSAVVATVALIVAVVK